MRHLTLQSTDKLSDQGVVMEERLLGIPVSAGVVISRVCLFNDRRHARLEPPPPGSILPERELARLNTAVDVALNQLADLTRNVADRIGPAEAGIFSAQAMILQDAELLRKIKAGIGSSVSASQSVAAVMDEYEARLAVLDSERIRERASDLGELKRRLIDILENTRPGLQCAGQTHCRKGHDRIIVAEELTPTLTMELDTRFVRGFVTEHGGRTSHAAILARALGIPAVTGVKGVHSSLACGTELIVDGDKGVVIVNPTRESKKAVGARTYVQVETAVAPVPGLRVAANISTATEAEAARSAMAEGIGLYRTEFEFFAAGRILTEDEQFDRYVSVLRAMPGKPVAFRLLDIGGDKSAPFFGLADETNPYLGLRGARLLIRRPELWRAQARALARASVHGDVQVIYPMIVDVDQFSDLRRMFYDAIRGLPSGRLLHGVMLEVPSACLLARELIAESDFVSLGANDLIQYLFAVDRNNEAVADDYHPDRPVFWKLVAEIAVAARDLSRSLTVCGELAADPKYAEKLLEVGINAVSVSPRAIGVVRRAVARGRLQS